MPEAPGRSTACATGHSVDETSPSRFSGVLAEATTWPPIASYTPPSAGTQLRTLKLQQPLPVDIDADDFVEVPQDRLWCSPAAPSAALLCQA